MSRAEIGLSPEDVDAGAPDEDRVREALGFAPSSDDPDEDLPSRAEMWAVIQSQQETIEVLEKRVEDLEDAREEDEKKRVEMAQSLNEARQNAAEAREKADEAKEIGKSASAVAHQSKDTETEHALPGDVEPSTSPLDFFANVSQHKAKKHFVDEKGEKNTYRALLIAKRWDEFATIRNDGAIHWDRDDVKDALTAILGEKPHGTTVTRVWEKLRDELGGDDLNQKRRRRSNKQEPKQILKMPRETAEGLDDRRYTHLDLLGGGKGVTPVVTGGRE